jgi:hypothetical protein
MRVKSIFPPFFSSFRVLERRGALVQSERWAKKAESLNRLTDASRGRIQSLLQNSAKGNARGADKPIKMDAVLVSLLWN